MYVKDKTSFTYVDKKHPNAIRLVQQMNHSNGIVGYVDKQKLPDKFKNKIEKAGKISINPDQPLSYYQDKEFIGNSVIIIDTSELSRNSCLYIVSELQRIRNGSTWNQKFPKSEVINAEISLPVKNSEIDFDFMDTFIAELEAERIAELEAERIAELSAYLKVSGLDNYELSVEELKALQDYDSMEWREFKLGNLFDVQTYKKRFDANKVDLVSEGGHPYVVRKSSDNGIKGYIRECTDYLNDGNTISFGQDTATSFYQEKPYFTGDKIKILKPKFQDFRKENALLFVAAITRSFSKFSWGNSSYSIQIIQNQKLCLPIKNNKIDILFIETFIKAMSKLIIQDVVRYADERIEATKEVVAEHNTI